MIEQIAKAVNVLGDFCGKRDVESLTVHCLQNEYAIEQADVMVLFGGSILCGGDVMACAMKNKIAGKYIIAGGAGHTTDSLRQRVHQEYPDIVTDGLSEAEIFSRYLETVYGLKADYLETESTNCGNNITYLIDLIRQNGVAFENVILCQDATMQRRMDAGLRKYVPDGVTVINYAAYKAEVVVRDGQLAYSSDIHGMWDMDRYVSLLMGEIPRLADHADGYGPKGKDFIAHVDIPERVSAAFEELKKAYGGGIREANPLYASR